ncbi:MAG TPA: endonuclease/exonuclease/phosphatase family protein, partial [Chloroflexota bacterium]|nr:endonuclease/exonuclease/phosphatase family protein [Chloroflexota bacterium]
LQEVAGRAQAERLAMLAGLQHVAFGAARRTKTGEFGNAVVCRWPLCAVENHAVPGGLRIGQARAVLAATIVADRLWMHAVAAHFGLLPREPELAVRVVLSLAATRNGPLIVGGDLNRSLPGAMCHRQLRGALIDAASVHGQAARPTFPAPRPLLRLDYLYVRDLVIHDTHVVQSSASDHRAVYTDVSTHADS